LGKVVADGQASLATADDDGLKQSAHEAKVRLRCQRRIAEIPHPLALAWSNLTIPDCSDVTMF
jgi:hypothetical protein